MEENRENTENIENTVITENAADAGKPEKPEFLKEQTEEAAGQPEGAPEPEKQEEVHQPKKNSSRMTFLKGLIAGIILSGLVFVLLRGYLTVTLPNGGSLTIRLPYYERLHGTGSGSLDHVEINRKMDEIRTLIDKSYLYDADPKHMTDGIFAGMLYGLTEDDYAIYYSKEDFENERKRLNGSYVGVGIAVTKDAKTNGLMVEAVTYNSPAQEAGIEVGDVILKANGTDLTQITSDEAVGQITGPEGTEVVLEIQRNGETMEVTCVRRVISDITVRTALMPEDPRVGYVSITGFTNVTEEEFYEAIDDLTENRNAEGIVIDLRNNGGGDMNVALRMIDSILPDDLPLPEQVGASDAGNAENGKTASGKTLLLSIEDKGGKKTEYFAEDDWRQTIPFAVLVNGRSASASEIFAGVLKDYGYPVIGTKTFGKGIVQSLYTLSDKSAVKFTTDQYILPDGSQIHGIGIEPSIEVEFREYDGITEKQVNHVSGEETPLEGDVQVEAAVKAIQDAFEAE